MTDTTQKIADELKELIKFVSAKNTTEECARKCLGFVVRYGDAISAALSARASAGEGGECNVEGTWLWGRLMDWCRMQGVPPSNYNELFAIARDAHKLFTPASPATGEDFEAWFAKQDSRTEWRELVRLAYYATPQPEVDDSDASLWPGP